MTENSEQEFPEEGIQDIADKFNEWADDGGNLNSRGDINAISELAQITKIHDVNSDSRIDFILAGYDRFVQREVMSAKSELREQLEQMERLFND